MRPMAVCCRRPAACRDNSVKIPQHTQSEYYPANQEALGGGHAVQDSRNAAVVRDCTCLFGGRTVTAIPAAITRTVVAATKLPTVTEVPLYFRAVSVTLPPGEASTVSAAKGILYQMSGSTEIVADDQTSTINPGEGSFIAAGKQVTLKAGSGVPSTFLHFFLAPATDLDRPAETTPATVKELYRTSTAIPDLKPGGYDLNLTRVTFPPQMPSNPPHHRSGAALYFIISGTGANTVDGKMETKGPGSLIYEPFGLVHQWGNPSSEPFTFLAFNINPEGIAAVLPGAPSKTQ